MPKDMPPKDIIAPSLASRLQVDSRDFFEQEQQQQDNQGMKRIPWGIFPSAAKFVPERTLFRTWFHGHTQCVELPLHAFPTQYHPRLLEIQHAPYSNTVSSVYHETDNALIHNLLLVTALDE